MLRETMQIIKGKTQLDRDKLSLRWEINLVLMLILITLIPDHHVG